MEFVGKPSNKTIQRLFAMSGNLCAYRDCDHPIIGERQEERGVNFGEVCHIKGNKPDSPRHDKAQSEEERNGFDNLILLCRLHHKLIDENFRAFPVEALIEMKMHHEARLGREIEPADAFAAKRLLDTTGSVSVSHVDGTLVIASPGSFVNVKANAKRVVIAAPIGTIGADRDKLRYSKYLVDKYNEMAAWDPDRQAKFHYGVVHRQVKNRYKSKLELIPDELFDELCDFLISKIKRTRAGKASAAKGQRFYSTFAEFKDGI